MRVLPWPDGARSARVLRREVFVRPDARELRRRTDDLVRHGFAATWFWAASAADPLRIGSVAARPGQEIALSGERLWGARVSDCEVLAEATGAFPAGATAHASADCFRFQGAPNLIWAEQNGLSYVEVPVRPHMHPYRFVRMLGDGAIVTTPILCLPPADPVAQIAGTDRLSERLAMVRAVGGLLQLELAPVHAEAPSGHGELDALPPRETDEIVGWTLEHVTRWWLATHVTGRLSLEARADGTGESAARRMPRACGSKCWIRWGSHASSPLSSSSTRRRQRQPDAAAQSRRRRHGTGRTAPERSKRLCTGTGRPHLRMTTRSAGRSWPPIPFRCRAAPRSCWSRVAR